MCLKPVSRHPLSFAVGNQPELYNIHPFFKSFPQKNVAGDVYKNDSHKRIGVCEKRVSFFKEERCVQSISYFSYNSLSEK